jgi:hypothetical protein
LSQTRPGIGGIVTLIAVSCAAYLVADIAHETLGHGGACIALGGHLNFVSTTFEDCSIHSRIIDGAGPIGGILAGLLAWAWLKLAPPRGQSGRIFLILLFAFAIFWNVFYLIRSGLTDQGDWAYVIAGLEPAFAWRAAIAVLGLVLYALAMRIVAALMERCQESGEGATAIATALTAFVAATILAAAAAALDRRSIAPDLVDRLPSALAAFGLVWAAVRLTRPGLRIALPVSRGWIAAGLLSAILFVAVLGPGLRF